MSGRNARLAELRTSPLAVLFRAFLLQFFSTDSANTEAHQRRTIASVLAFLILPTIFMVVQLAPAYQFTLLRATVLNTPEIVDQFLVALGAVFVTFSMVTTGFIAAFLWDVLGFDRRDAVVLGSLPLRGRTIVLAKVAALTALFAGTAVSLNLITALPFAVLTADRPNGPGLVAHLTAHLGATIPAAAFVFAATVALRGIIGLCGGARAAGALASTMQFVFVSALLSVIVLIQVISPGVLAGLDPERLRWVPPAWFLAVFERGLDLTRPRFGNLASMALPATGLAVIGAVVVSAIGLWREMRMALAPSALTDPLGHARLSRLAARLVVGRDAVARAAADFILLTLARSRSVRGPVAMNAALGVAIIVFALWRAAADLESLMRPRTAVLWIPLVMAYWLAIGVRASFFVPSELPSAWVFRLQSCDRPVAYWSAVRTSILVFVFPRVMAIVAALALVVGPRVAVWHALIVFALLVLLSEVVASTIHHVPFTREYLPGHARLKSRWPLYLGGMFAFAYWPVQLELRLLGNPTALWTMAGVIGVLAVACELVARWAARRAEWQLESEEDEDAMTVLDLANTAAIRMP